jgi:hypothetical protein
MGWGYIARMGEKCMMCLVGHLKERNHHEDLWDRIIFKWILKLKYGWCGLDSSGSRKGQVPAYCVNSAFFINILTVQ